MKERGSPQETTFFSDWIIESKFLSEIILDKVDGTVMTVWIFSLFMALPGKSISVSEFATNNSLLDKIHGKIIGIDITKLKSCKSINLDFPNFKIYIYSICY